MTARTLAVLGTALALTACSNGVNLNPLTWFSAISNDPGLVAIEPEGGWPDAQDGRIAVSQVTSLKIEHTTAGAIVHATGIPPRLGYWDAELVPENNGEPDKGVMTYVFRIAEPRWNQGNGTPYSRSVEVAAFLSNVELKNVRSIRVMGENNGLTARR